MRERNHIIHVMTFSAPQFSPLQDGVNTPGQSDINSSAPGLAHKKVVHPVTYY